MKRTSKGFYQSYNNEESTAIATTESILNWKRTKLTSSILLFNSFKTEYSCLPQSVILHIFDFVSHFNYKNEHTDHKCSNKSCRYDMAAMQAKDAEKYDHWYPYSITQQFSKNHIEIGYFRSDPMRRVHLLTRHLLFGGTVFTDGEKWRVAFALKNCRSVAFDCHLSGNDGNLTQATITTSAAAVSNTRDVVSFQSSTTLPSPSSACSSSEQATTHLGANTSSGGHINDSDDNHENDTYRKGLMTRRIIHLLSRNSNLESIAFLQSDSFIISWIDQMMNNKRECISQGEHSLMGVAVVRNAIDHLKSIYIHSAPLVTSRSIVCIVNHFKNLKSLCLRSIDLSQLDMNGGDEAMRGLSAIERVDMSGTGASDQVVSYFMSIPSLKCLDLDNMKHLSASTVEYVCSHPSLTSLSLEGMSLSMDAYRLLSRNCTLQRLSLRLANLNNDTLKLVLTSTSIQELCASCACFIGYPISYGLDALEHNQTIRELDISGWVVEDVRLLLRNTSLQKLTCGDEMRHTMKKILRLDPSCFGQTKLQKLIIRTDDLSTRDSRALRLWLPEHIKVKIAQFTELQDFGCTETEYKLENFC